MSKCLKCGAHLPPVGDCPRCALAAEPTVQRPRLLGSDLQLDRRRGTRAASGGLEVSDLEETLENPTATAIGDTPTRVAPAMAMRLAKAEAAAVFEEDVGREVEREPEREGATGPGLDARPAPLWRRLGAGALDLCVVGSVVALFLIAATRVSGVKVPATKLGGLDALMLEMHALQSVLLPALILGGLLAMVYTAVFAFLWEGRTPGRRLFGIRLVDGSGLAPAPARAVVRALLSALSFGLFLGGFWLALFDRRGQTLHDKLTSTFVVRPI